MSNNESRPGRVAGKRVLITGAARGMGRSHAVRLAEEGADLILVDICESLPELEYPLSTREDLAETARLAEKHGSRVITHVLDVRDSEALAAASRRWTAKSRAPGQAPMAGDGRLSECVRACRSGQCGLHDPVATVLLGAVEGLIGSFEPALG